MLKKALPAIAVLFLLYGCGGVPGSSIGAGLWISPNNATIAPGGTQALTASLVEAGEPTSDYEWTIREGASGGSLTLGSSEWTSLHNQATYTAPTTPGKYHVDVTAHWINDTFHKTVVITVQ